MSAIPSANFKTIDATTISGAGVTRGKALNMRAMARASFQVVWTSTLAGAFTWEATNSRGDNLGAPPSTATWTVLSTAFTGGDPAGTAGDYIFEFLNLGDLWLRPVFTYSSGSGVLDVFVNAKGI